MTWPAQRLQVRFIVRPAAIQRQDVVNMFRRCQPAVLPAQLAQWVGHEEPFAYPPPFHAVPRGGRRVTLVLVVALVYFLLMRRAVPAIHQRRAAGVGTRAARFVRHGRITLLYGI